MVSNSLFGQFGSERLLTPIKDDSKSNFAADMDNDGDLDFVSTTGNYNQIIWYKNLGEGIFGIPIVISTVLNTTRHLTGYDIDSDGDTDIFAASYNDNKISWIPNLGSGNFGSPIMITNLADGANFVSVGDLNGDGFADVFSCSANDNEMARYMNLGNNTFGSQQIISNNIVQPSEVYPLKINNDTLTDLLCISRFDRRVYWYPNAGNNVLGTSVTIAILDEEPQSLCGRDIDFDGDQDVFVTTSLDSKVIWFENLGNANFGSPTIYSTTPHGAGALDIGDLDNDGDLDIVWSAQTANSIGWHENIGTNNFNTFEILGTDAMTPADVDIADFSGDGLNDILTGGDASASNVYFKNMGGGSFYQGQKISPEGNRAGSSITADLDNNGFDDIIWVIEDYNRIEWYRNLGNGIFADHRIITQEIVDGRAIFAADLDNDGLLDIISGSDDDYKIAWYKNLNGVDFGPQQILTTSGGARSLCAYDFDNDGDMDIVGGRLSSIVLFENLGGLSFGPMQILTTTVSNVLCVDASDVDGDGEVDIIATSYVNSKFLWCPNLGNLNFGTSINFTGTTNSPKWVDPVDMDFDGDDDYVIGTSSGLYWKENLGNGNLNSNYIAPMSINHTFSTDIDLDGDIDIITSNTSDQLTIHKNNNFFFTSSILTNTYDGARSFIATDLDNDGDHDAVAVANTNSKVAWFRNHTINKTEIGGRSFVDLNQNNINDPTDPGINNLGHIISPQIGALYSDTSGHYFSTFESEVGNYILQPQGIPNWYIVTDSTNYTILMDTLNPVNRYDLDFGYFFDTIVNDLQTDLDVVNSNCEGMLQYQLRIKNVGTSIPSGTIKLTLDPNLSFNVAAPSPDSIIGQDIFWSFTSLMYFEDTTIFVQANLPGNSFNGAQIVSYLSTEIIDNSNTVVFSDQDSLNHQLNCNPYSVTKEVNPNGSGPEGLIDINTAYLDYTISFQNTGIDTVHEIIITDQLDSNLNWSSLTPLTSSHNFTPIVDGNGNVTFTFDAIELLDSSINILESHGFIKYRVYLNSNLPLGTKIYNTAQIYFDGSLFNQTDTTLNTLYNCSQAMNSLQLPIETCFNETVTGSILDSITSTVYNWEIENVIIVPGANFQWIADSANLFDVHFSMSNSLCSMDTFITLNVLPEIETQALPDMMICAGENVLIFGNYQSIDGLYIDTLSSINGCDSIVHQTLIVWPISPTTYLQTINICEGDSVEIFGEFKFIADNYYNLLQTIHGCDSLVSVELIVNPIPIVTIAELIQDSLCIYSPQINLPIGSPSGGSYSGTGVSSSYFDPGIAGSGIFTIVYSYSENNCIGEDFLTISVDNCLSLYELSETQLQWVFPNPTTGIININLTDQFWFYTITDHLGRTVLSGSQTSQINIEDQSSGTYFITITTENSILNSKLIKL